ncbi:MAG: hypothetical protein AAB508_05610 [Patescibacteria group bacterium]
MSEKNFIQFIADYGVGDPAFGEVIQKFMLLDPSLCVHPTSVPKFSTLATGFWTHQFAVVNPLTHLLIYTNTAPRKDNKEKRQEGDGEKLVYAELKNGVRVVGVNAGYCFSFIKPFISSLHLVNVANKGSQFRSRDFYPEAVVGIAHEDKAFIGQALDISNLPDAPENRIAWIDGYGNIKTSMRGSSIKFHSGQPVIVTINGMKRTALFTDGSFSVHEGELAFAPGSSGGSDKFMEIFLRGLSAWKEFGKPNIEEEFTVKAE